MGSSVKIHEKSQWFVTFWLLDLVCAFSADFFEAW